VTGLWILPFLVAGALGAILLAGVRRGAGAPERELRGLVREDRVANLVASLRRTPKGVRSARRSMLRNRLTLDLGDMELEVHCYTLPREPVDRLVAVYFQPSVGWVVETEGHGRRTRVFGWHLDVRAASGAA
jgi:hypothetical protein